MFHGFTDYDLVCWLDGPGTFSWAEVEGVFTFVFAALLADSQALNVNL